MNSTESVWIEAETSISDNGTVEDDYLYEVNYYGYDYTWMESGAVKFAYALPKYALPVISAIGIPGNILTLVVLFSKRYGWHPSNISLAVLATVDTVILTQLLTSLCGISHYTIRYVALCKFWLAMKPMTQKYSSLILSFIMIERVISVSYPLHAKRLLTQTRLILANVGILGFLVVYHIPFLIAYTIIPDPVVVEVKHCHYPVKHEFWADFYIFGWGKAILESVLPLLIIFGCVIKIIIVLKRKNNLTNSKSTSEDDKIKSITIMLLSVGIAFLVLMSLTIVDELGFPLGLYDLIPSPQGDIISEVMMQISFVFARINNGINFILYCATGTKFRRTFVAIFCGGCRRRNCANIGQGGIEAGLSDVNTASTSIN